MRGYSLLLMTLAFGPLALIAGCSRTHAQVSGRVVENGQPYKHTGEMVQLVMSCDAPSVTVAATVQPDGTFKFFGTEGKGLSAGKYKLGINSDVESAPGVAKRIRAALPQKSLMEIDLAGGESLNLTIDLTKHALTR